MGERDRIDDRWSDEGGREGHWRESEKDGERQQQVPKPSADVL